MESLPEHSWTRRFDAADPDPSVHTFTRPPVLEVLGLLPIAYRVGTYVNTERSNGRDPIFDLAGIALQPPNPGPHAGAPLGGLGGGSIGRGFRGEFRRWSLTPGRYVHRTVVADAFSLRVQRGDQTWSVVLSVHPPSISSPLASWDWSLPRSCATYHALFPRSWTVYESPVPDVIVVVKQLSPFLPHSYSEASLPCAVFEVEVTNTHPTLAAEVSVMFTFQNGSGGEEDEDGGFAHASFKAEGGTRGAEGYAAGVCLARHTTVPAKHSAGIPVTPDISAPVVSSSSAETTSATTDDSDGDSSPLPSDSPLPRNNEPWSCQCSFSIASTTVPLDDYTEAEVDQGVGLDLGPRAGAGTGAGTGGCSPLSPKLTEVGLEEVQLSTCSQFITDFTPRSFSLADLLARCRAGSGGTEEAEGVDAFQYLQESGMGDSARQLWSSFHATGNIAESQFSGAYSSPDVSVPGTKVGAAVCLRQWLGPACGG
ncbi:beta-Glucocerebrosidase 2 N terminal-domain-containing protein, partial [Ochromonadaceae sp. CCMP2298]